MRIIEMGAELRIAWEAPSRELICQVCHGVIDIKTLHQNSLECVNFVWPDKEALRAGEFFYLHKRCANIKGNWYMLDVKTVIGKDRFPGMQSLSKEMRRILPTEAWEYLQSTWLPKNLITKVGRVAKEDRPQLRRLAAKLSLRFQILKRDSYRCRLCGSAARDGEHVRLEVDHITPRSKGGTDDPSNLWTLCFPCNRGKGVQVL